MLPYRHAQAKVNPTENKHYKFGASTGFVEVERSAPGVNLFYFLNWESICSQLDIPPIKPLVLRTETQLYCGLQLSDQLRQNKDLFFAITDNDVLF